MGRVGCYRAPGSKNRFLCTRASLSVIVQYAYDLESYELRPPASTDTSEFNIEAIVASSATPQQIPLMLRNLLTERFKLAFHRETAEVKGFALIVADSGLKIQKSPDAPTPGETKRPTGPAKDSDGFVYIPGIRNYVAMSQANGLIRWVGNDIALASEVRNTPRLTQLLYSVIHQPVIDSTGLEGKYDFVLTFTSDSMGTGATLTGPDSNGLPQASEFGPTIFKAVEEQLGLKLQPRRIVVSLFVVDHAEANPSEN